MNFKILLQKLRNFLNRHPKIKNFVKNVMPQGYITKLSYEKHTQDKFASFYKNGTLIHMSLSPLEDKRGIGRVTREQLSYLKKNLSPYTQQKYTKEIYFYSSIHWCPETLKQNSYIIIHDVTPLVLKELFLHQSQIWETKFKAIAKQAEHIITISENSKADIHKFLDIEKEKISVILNGVTPLHETKKINDLPQEYFVYLGAYDHHKNLDVLFYALCDESCKKEHLVLIGDNLEAKKRVQALGIIERVHFLGKQSDAEVSYIIKNATALLFPSLYEGFGLPPMEAALLDTPSICSKRPTMTEFLYGVALFADPYNPANWAQEMQKLKNNTTLGEELALLAKQRVEKLSWEKSCSNLVELLIR